MSRYANIDLRLDRGASLCSDYGIVRGWVWGSTPSSLHSSGGFTIEQEIECCEIEHYRCRYFFTDSRFNGDGIILECWMSLTIHITKIKSALGRTAPIPGLLLAVFLIQLAFVTVRGPLHHGVTA